MSEQAPERINVEWKGKIRGYYTLDRLAGHVEYIRADLYEAQAKRIAELEKQYADLYEAASYRDFDLMEHPGPGQ